jgi:predicted RNA-binding protein with TRAM domain
MSDGDGGASKNGYVWMVRLDGLIDRLEKAMVVEWAVCRGRTRDEGGAVVFVPELDCAKLRSVTIEKIQRIVGEATATRISKGRIELMAACCIKEANWTGIDERPRSTSMCDQ